MTLSENLTHYIRTSPYFAQFDQENPDRRKVFLERFESLPENVREFLMSPETAANIDAVRVQYSLSDDEGEFLARSIREVTLGTVGTADIPGFLAKKFGIDEIAATNIARSLVQNVLSTLKNPPSPKTQPQPGSGIERGNTVDLRNQG